MRISYKVRQSRVYGQTDALCYSLAQDKAIALWTPKEPKFGHHFKMSTRQEHARNIRKEIGASQKPALDGC